MRQENNYLADSEYRAEETAMKCSVFEKSQNAVWYNRGKETKMNITQAKREAKKRWGVKGWIRFDASAPTKAEAVLLPKGDNNRYRRKCTVGKPYVIPGLGEGCLVMGQGDTWEEAFAEREAKP